MINLKAVHLQLIETPLKKYHIPVAGNLFCCKWIYNKKPRKKILGQSKLRN